MAPIAILTVGAGALLVGRDVLGLSTALDVAAAMWAIGTLSGLSAFVAVPLALAFARPRRARGPWRLRDVQATWLLPLVPPMVSAATGAALVGRLPAGDARLALLLGCWTLFALSLAACAPIIALVALRVARHGAGEPRMVPTLWIVLGPLGQSITAANLLAAAAHGGGVAHAGTFTAFAVRYGAVVAVLALGWLALAATLTLRTARRAGLPFGLTWWSFTFPVGTCATGTSELALHLSAPLFTPIALGLCALLTVAWATVAARTARWVPPRLRPAPPLTPVDA
jgi:tellurite resistance protein TehA-like permease